jgi:hypothetical protein
MSDPPGGLTRHFGNCELSAIHCLNFSFRDVVMLSGILRQDGSIYEVSGEMPREVESLEIAVAWVTYVLDTSGGGAFKPQFPVVWLELGRKWRTMLPWEKECTKHTKKARVQEPFPPLRVIESRMNQSEIIWQLSNAVCQRVTQEAIAHLQGITLKEALALGPHSGLRNTWEEICVQVQFEESVIWEVYEEMVDVTLTPSVEALPEYEQAAVWRQTDEGSYWECHEDEDDPQPCPICHSDIVEYIKQEYLYPAAGSWSSPRVESYIERASMRD